jgi:bifunctional UDP-N-acetylglucosamine pyrophosphorylase/glucosamine-1-phosphate N-acetyltransferase
MSSSRLSVIALAAGKGTRMKSGKAKVLHEVFFSPMIHHVVNAILPLTPGQIIAVIGHQQEAVRQVLHGFAIDFAVQEQQLGTGHAVLVTEDTIKAGIDTVMVLCGDTPLIRPETLVQMASSHWENKATLTLMTTFLENPTNYGRVLSTPDGKPTAIVEQKDATPAQLLIKEINAGIYCIDRKFLFSALKGVGTNNSQNEIYLTDIVKIAVENGLPVEKFTAGNPLEVLGVNSRVELAEAHCALQLRRNNELMAQGVSIQQPHSIEVAPTVIIERDTTIEPCVRITGNSRIGASCLIGQGALLTNCHIGDRVSIGPYSVLSGATINSESVLPAFSKT